MQKDNSGDLHRGLQVLSRGQVSGACGGAAVGSATRISAAVPAVHLGLERRWYPSDNVWGSEERPPETHLHVEP